VARALGLPTQAYMALGDGKFLDAQAGAETFGGALLAALAGINSVSGPGMLDYVLTFSLEKLVLDDDLCGQALHFVREIAPRDDLPAVPLARALLEEQHLVTAGHTLHYWPEELYLPGPVTDRQNRESWARAGARTLQERARSEIARRLAAYEPVATDPALDAEMRALLHAGMTEKRPLPAVPTPEETAPAAARNGRQRRRMRRR
jgi:trimethylamine--corrinoid protein Co-methyltransferase